MQPPPAFGFHVAFLFTLLSLNPPALPPCTAASLPPPGARAPVVATPSVVAPPAPSAIEGGASLGRMGDFPRPAALTPQISFWTQIYSKYTTSQAVIHDSERLDVVYTVIDLDPATPGGRRLSRQHLKQVRGQYVAALKHLAEAPETTELTELERAVKAVWGDETEPEVFRAASGRVRSQIGQADRFRDGIQRAGRYLPAMRAIMAEHGLPDELLAIPHVESSFNPAALSHRGASGIWQWTRRTGRQFMRIDPAADERRDPLLATRAAGICLRGYYEELGSWPLAITAYNHGIQGVRRAHARYGTDIAAILTEYDGRSFQFASRNFYTEFLAALDVSRNYKEHFGELVLEPPIEFDSVPLARPVSFHRAAAIAEVAPAELARLNPGLLQPVISGKRPIPGGYELRVPAGLGSAMAVRLEASPEAARSALSAGTGGAGGSGSGTTAASSGSAASGASYRVRRGDTLGHIARRYRTSIGALCELNGLDTHRIYAGQKLLVPDSSP